MVCEKGIYDVETISNMLVPQSSETLLIHKLQTIPKKTWMFHTNYHMMNHNVETCKVKRKEDLALVIFEVITQQIKV